MPKHKTPRSDYKPKKKKKGGLKMSRSLSNMMGRKKWGVEYKKKGKKNRKAYNKNERFAASSYNDPVGGNTYSAIEKDLSNRKDLEGYFYNSDIKDIARTRNGWVGDVDGTLRDLTEFFDDEGNYKKEGGEEYYDPKTEVDKTKTEVEKTEDPYYDKEDDPYYDPYYIEEEEEKKIDKAIEGSGSTEANPDESSKDEEGEVKIDELNPKDAAVAPITTEYKGEQVPVYEGTYGQAYRSARDNGGAGSLFSWNDKIYKSTSADENGSWWDGTPFVPGKTLEETKKTLEETKKPKEFQEYIGKEETKEQKEYRRMLWEKMHKLQEYVIGKGIKKDGVYKVGFDFGGLAKAIQEGVDANLERSTQDNLNEMADNMIVEGDVEAGMDLITESLMSEDPDSFLQVISQSDTSDVDVSIDWEPNPADPLSDLPAAHKNPVRLDENGDPLGHLQEAQNEGSAGFGIGAAINVANQLIPDKTLTGATTKAGQAAQWMANKFALSKATTVTMRNITGSFGKWSGQFGGLVFFADSMANLSKGNYGEAGLDFVGSVVLFRQEKLPGDFQKLYKLAKSKFGPEVAKQIVASNIHKAVTGSHIAQGWGAFRTANKGKNWTKQQMSKKYQVNKTKADALQKAKNAPKKPTSKATKTSKLNKVTNALLKNWKKYGAILGKRAPLLALSMGVSVSAFAIPEPISTAAGALMLGFDAYLMYDMIDELYDDMSQDPDFLKDSEAKVKYGGAERSRKRKENLKRQVYVRGVGYKYRSEGGKLGNMKNKKSQGSLMSHLTKHNNMNDASYRRGGKLKKRKSLYAGMLSQENENNNNSGE